MDNENEEMFFRNVGKYVLVRYLSSGSFGSVYLAYRPDMNNQDLYAVKVENRNSSKKSLLVREARILKLLGSKNYFGIPRIFNAGSENSYNFLVMECLGPSLEALLHRCGGRFSLKTVLMLGFQMINRLNFCHRQNFCHQDVKPSNFCMGIHERSHLTHIIDFGLSQSYRENVMDSESSHIQQNFHNNRRRRNSIIGTARFASIRNHLGVVVSRRDDLESLGYVLIYFLIGSLPWQGIMTPPPLPPQSTTCCSSNNNNNKHQNRINIFKQERDKKILETKIQFHKRIKRRILILEKEECNNNNNNNNNENKNNINIMNNIPHEFLVFIDHVRNLEFDEDPDYDYYRSMFSNLFRKCNFEYDYKYDWVVSSTSSSTSSNSKKDHMEIE